MNHRLRSSAHIGISAGSIPDGTQEVRVNIPSGLTGVSVETFRGNTLFALLSVAFCGFADANDRLRRTHAMP